MKRIALVIVVAMGGCALLGGGGTGEEDLPLSGAGPYGKTQDLTLSTPADEPYIITDATGDLTHPSPIFAPGGGAGYRVFYTRTPHPAGTGGAEIWAADLTDLHNFPTAMMSVLTLDADWETGGVQDPAVVDLGHGKLVMYYSSGDQIGRALSSDGGTTWQKSGPVLQDAASPAAVTDGKAWFLYFTRPDPGDPAGIFTASSVDGMNFTTVPDPVLVTRPLDGGAFDEIAVGQPFATGGTDPVGDLHIGLFYVGTSGAAITAIGYAGSYDGVTFERGNLGKPVLDPGAPSETGPGVLLGPASDVMFFAQARAGLQAIAAATDP